MSFIVLETGGKLTLEDGAGMLLENGTGIEIVERAHLLPSSATTQEMNISKAIGRIEDIPTADLKKLKSASECPADFLPWLAWEVSVDYWDSAWTERQKRDAISNSLTSHQSKGTPQSIIDAVALLGWTASIVENQGTFRNGRYLRDGSRVRNGRIHFQYNIQISTIVTLTQDQKNRIRALAEAFAPARCHLVNITEVSP